MRMKELAKTYDPKGLEDRLYKKWEENGYFHAEVDRSKKPFTIVMPPPNITGQLHMGHALDNTLQDILIRYKRMQGYSALWLPGQDHAGIATQIRVEEELQLSDIDRQFYNVLRHLEPFGPNNPHPLFVTRALINNRYTKRVGKLGEHLKLDLTDRSLAISGIAFGKGEMATFIQNGNAVDVCYSIEQNTYNGVTSLQMKVEDIIPATN